MGLHSGTEKSRHAINVYLPAGFYQKYLLLKQLGLIDSFSRMVQDAISDLSAKNSPEALDEKIREKEDQLQSLKRIRDEINNNEGERSKKEDNLLAAFRRRFSGGSERRVMLEWIGGRRHECWEVFGKGNDKEYLEKLLSSLKESVGGVS